MGSEEFIELNRTFIKLPREHAQDAAGDNIEYNDFLRFRTSKDLNWAALLQEHRVIILAPAGAGKTTEIRKATRNLRSIRKPAFFIRIEHISNNLEGAFEEGDLQEFEQWLESDEEGWLFLDSIDEARLKDTHYFEEAIRKIAVKLKPAKQRVHVIITGRFDTWRKKTDLDLCNKQFEYSIPPKEVSKPSDEDIGSNQRFRKFKTQKDEKKGKFEVYAICNLSNNQLEIFSHEKNVSNCSEFLKAIEKQGANVYTERPQDLIDVILFWEKYKRVGTRLELMQNSVERRLEERRQNTAVVKDISSNKVREGVRLLAAASTLMKESIIEIPNENNCVGLNIKKLLPDWNPDEHNTILGRPIFGGAIYGAVRLSRPTREFLTAEWLSDCLNRGAPREDVESLFFKKIYGNNVLVPSMRSILPWMILFDEKIRERARKIGPEVIFEGGDPSQLPFEVRTEVLRNVCYKINSGTPRHLATDYSAAQRFASPDIAQDIKSLIEEYQKNTTVTSFLIRMIWLGRIEEALPEAKSFALNNTVEKHVRIPAIMALKEIGSNTDLKELLDVLSSQEEKIDREILSSVVNILDPDQGSIDWIFDILDNTEENEKFKFDTLNSSLVEFVEKLDHDFLFKFVKKIDLFLNKKPFIRNDTFKISEHFSWLMNSGGRAVERLLDAKHPQALDSESISLISKIPSFSRFPGSQRRSLTLNISELAKDWPKLNFALFWKYVEEVRKKHSFGDRNDRLTCYRQAGWFEKYWAFDSDDFDRVKNEITSRSILDDKLVALTLAFQLYDENDRPAKWLKQLEKIVRGKVELERQLSNMLSPPSQEKESEQQDDELRKLNEKSRNDDEEQRKENEKNHTNWMNWLKQNHDILKEEKQLRDVLKKGSVFTAQRYLLDRMRETKENSHRWAEDNWRDLIDEFGLPIAKSFRDGLLLSWRFYQPALRSKNGDQNGTPAAVIIGLSGLKIESKEVENWPNHLTKKEAKLACHYAFHELNGFPDWFSDLYKVFPDVVKECILKEVYWEIETTQNGQEKHYIIDKLTRNDEVEWSDFAPELINYLKEEQPSSSKCLSGCLKIIQGSEIVSNKEIAQIASTKCREIKDLDYIAHWFAAWIGVDPDEAIKKLSKHLKKEKQNSNTVQLAMQIIVNLIGVKTGLSYAREEYKSPKHLKNLYLLMHKYIKVEEDIDRAGKGAYWPELRDHAQRARSSLYYMLANIQGKEAYSALVEVAKEYPEKTFRSVFMYRAKERAENDADFDAWQYSDVLRLNNPSKKKMGYLMRNWKGIIVPSIIGSLLTWLLG